VHALEKNSVCVSWYAVEIILIGSHVVLVSWTKGDGALTIVSKQSFFIFRLFAKVYPFVISLQSLNILLQYKFECFILFEKARVAEIRIPKNDFDIM
jgi:hypothetical protein